VLACRLLAQARVRCAPPQQQAEAALRTWLEEGLKIVQ
jgi:hypothetical protein